MSDASHYHGPVVNMTGGRQNVGVNYGTVGGGAGEDDGLRAAVAELVRLLGELGPRLAPEQARAVEEALPELVPDRAALRERGLVLASVAQIAAAAGAVGRPVAEAVGQLIGLLR
ncbi:hypothetical protein [Streptomyces sp. NPDC089919]|uniref:hypothetical protein n=1 Tax=Streptomyces sp. NPDC089919 TaxID=3155188 RepID=UPI003415CA4A